MTSMKVLACMSAHIGLLDGQDPRLASVNHLSSWILPHILTLVLRCKRISMQVFAFDVCF